MSALERRIASNARRIWNALVVVLAIHGCASYAEAQTAMSGHPRIVDGDTVVIGDVKVRLHGMDAPETDQICLTSTGARWTCGIEARDRLAAYASKRRWACTLTGTDRYERQIGSCSVDGVDIQKWMITNGWALAFRRYSHDYDRDEDIARETQTGLWSGAFIAPWDWRARSKQTTVLGALEVPISAQAQLLSAASAQAAPSQNCVIKGNVNREGVCIFHVPGGRFYSRTKIDIGKGERWFCNAEEAVAAGCRQSMQ